MFNERTANFFQEIQTQAKRPQNGDAPFRVTEEGRAGRVSIACHRGLRRLGYIVAAVTPLSQQRLTDERPTEAKYVLAEPTLALFGQIKPPPPPTPPPRLCCWRVCVTHRSASKGGGIHTRAWTR